MVRKEIIVGLVLRRMRWQSFQAETRAHSFAVRKRITNSAQHNFSSAQLAVLRLTGKETRLVFALMTSVRKLLSSSRRINRSQTKSFRVFVRSVSNTYRKPRRC